MKAFLIKSTWSDIDQQNPIGLWIKLCLQSEIIKLIKWERVESKYRIIHAIIFGLPPYCRINEEGGRIDCTTKGLHLNPTLVLL